MPTNSSQNVIGARPKEHEHVYDFAKKTCTKCKGNTTHKYSIKWGNGDYKLVITCNDCDFCETVLVTQEFCGKITPLVYSAS